MPVSSWPVTMTIGTSYPGLRARRVVHSSKPLLPGNSTSSSTRSGWSDSNAAMASRLLLAIVGLETGLLQGLAGQQGETRHRHR